MTKNLKLEKSSDETLSPLQRTFMIGDEWLYYKFYSGPKTADVILTELVKPIAEELLAQGVINRWFFIRYADPKLHARVRFHVTDIHHLGIVIQQVKSAARYFIEQNLVWKVQVDTYQREVERYGSKTMELAEELFFHDSKMIVDMLSLIEGDEGERIRWLFGLRTVDALLDDFMFDMPRKFELVTRLREQFGKEHGLNRNLKEQLEKKYRTDRASIAEVLDRGSDEVSEMLPLFQLINQKSVASRAVATTLLALYEKKAMDIPLEDLLSSYSHMMVNRMFKSKQRTHEMVLYDFLHRYYKSEIARQKYKPDKNKK